MEDDWESLAIEKIEPVVKAAAVSNKWAGEDDDDDVKESWEDEEEKKDEEKSDSTKDSSPVKSKPKISKTKLAAKERLEEEEEAKRLENMTPEEKIAEKLRLQKIQEESDLNFALDTFGVSSAGIDSLNPQSKEDFKEYGANLSARLSHYKDSPHFPHLIEDLVRNVCVNLSSADLKKVKITVETIYTEKLKAEKQTKKPAAKGKVKVSLKTDTDDIDTYRNYGEATADFDDYDDFM